MVMLVNLLPFNTRVPEKVRGNTTLNLVSREGVE
jgi:hypothetical protein